MSKLEETATAPSDIPAQTEALPPGATFDHFQIEQKLGSGGMGVVYAAMDVDLQRRVALKLLRDGLADESQQRLLREARAMARLSHPNVVTVWEVGRANNRDFVAMELIDGESLAEWLRAEPRPQREILDAFVAAGRGLAAAHAAGIVHRDFKPHNVLRSRGGRIVVTDFGLARDATDPLATTQPTHKAVTALSSGDLTVPGAVLGTPAYMAPEQWSGGRLTAATDQFAFCVALWEALDGERPYRGTTAEQLREQVTRGPDGLDDAKLPRRLRAILRRGLAPDPGKRWSSMDALLAHILPTRRIAIVAIAVAAALVAGGIVFAMTRGKTGACRAPAIDASIAGEAWHAQRASACAAPAAVRERQLACLDHVLARTAAIGRVHALAKKASKERVERFLAIDPAVCVRENAPVLPSTYSDDMVAAMALRFDVEPATDQRARSSKEPCAKLAVALHDMGLVGDHAACADDTLQTELALSRFVIALQGLSDVELADRSRALRASFDAAGRAAMGWQIDLAVGIALRTRRRFAEAIAAFDNALALALEREDVVIMQQAIETYLDRAHPADLEKVRKDVATWRPIAQRYQMPDVDLYLEWLDATAQWLQGDLANARPRLLDLHERAPVRMPGVEVHGTVVDSKGAPVADADVVAGIVLMGDPNFVATPLHSIANALRMFEVQKSDAKGAFSFNDAPTCFGSIVAQRGTERSKPVTAADGARLVLEPTTRVRGRAELGGRVGTFIVSVSSLHEGSMLGAASVNAPLGPDHRFDVTGVVPGDAMISVGEGGRTFYSHIIAHRVHIDPKKPIDDLVLELPAGRELRVLIRNQASEHTPVFAISGKFEAKTAKDLFRIPIGKTEMATTEARSITGAVPAELVGTYRDGDLLAMFTSAPIGPTTICTMQVVGRCVGANMPLHCTQIAANAALVVIDGSQ